MDIFTNSRAHSGSRLGLILMLALFLLIPAACSVPTPTPLACTGGYQLYEGACMSPVTIEFMVCTKGKGVNTSEGFEGAIGGDFRVVADASLKVAYNKTKTEDNPVSLEIVKGCLDLAKNSATSTPQERTAAVAAGNQADQLKVSWDATRLADTATLTLSSESAKKGAQVTVSGTRFQANEMVDLYVHAALVKQVQADGKGAFSAVITIPSSAPPPEFSTTIHATGQTSVKSAKAPFQTAP